jgi:TrmH family RNA methyltransferase
MITKNHIKILKQLQQKKFRNIHKMFIVEGAKSINEFLNSDFKCLNIFHLSSQTDFNNYAISLEVSENQLSQITALKQPNDCLAIFEMKETTSVINSDLILVLDDISDPGNLGTIIRLCDWFGVKNIVCSPNTVDVYNPKVVQATMGSLSRVNIHYRPLVDFLQHTNLPIYGTFMSGKSIYQQHIKKGCLVMGSEANGISQAVEHLINKKIMIPRFGQEQKTESLNVAVATTIILNEIFRIH